MAAEVRGSETKCVYILTGFIWEKIKAATRRKDGDKTKMK